MSQLFDNTSNANGCDIFILQCKYDTEMAEKLPQRLFLHTVYKGQSDKTVMCISKRNMTAFATFML